MNNKIEEATGIKLQHIVHFWPENESILTFEELYNLVSKEFLL